MIVVETENCCSNSFVVRNWSVTEVGSCVSKFCVQGTTVSEVETLAAASPMELPPPLLNSSKAKPEAGLGAPSARWLRIQVRGQPLYSRMHGPESPHCESSVHTVP
ncbi:MAG: hypothetical protein KatS3mg076_2328 [Candidatus Binatia bacterium]|nr:MAG: hypothetical protein KatS3mg076_2328 [Candidatus Binatia bacterium]